MKWGTVPLSIAILVKAGRAADLLNFAVRVMDYDTGWFQTHVVQKGEANLGLFVNFQVSNEAKAKGFKCIREQWAS